MYRSPVCHFAVATTICLVLLAHGERCSCRAADADLSPENRAEHGQRRAFETAARKLKAGSAQSLFKALPGEAHDGTLTSMVCFDSKDNYVTITSFFFKHHWYCLYFVRLRNTEDTWAEVRLYRLKPAPERYKAQTKRGKQKITRESDGKTVERDRRGRYLADFYEIITGRETGDLGIQHKLIHLDAS